MSEAISLSVIIVSYHCRALLEDCLKSIDHYNDIGDALEVIVVDNSVDSDTVDWLRAARPDVKAVKNENKGFGEANNVGARLASGRYLLFLNPDTLLVEPVFRFALENFERDPKLGCFGVQLLDGEGRRGPSSGFRMPMGFARITLCRMITKAGLFFPSFMYVSGADCFIRAEAFRRCGMFDENIFMYCEEADLANRLNRLGYRLGFFPEKHIVHLEGKTQESRLAEKYIREMRSRKYYCEKYGEAFSRWGRRELRYCRFKRFLLRSRDPERSREYARIVAFWEDTLRQEGEKGC